MFRIFAKLFFSLKTPPYFRLGVLFSFDGYRIPCENEKNIKKALLKKIFLYRYDTAERRKSQLSARRAQRKKRPGNRPVAIRFPAASRIPF